MLDISVIIATYNRAAVLEETLRAFCELDTDGMSWELVVVDNNCSDRTKTVIESFGDRLPIRYLFEPRQGKNVALNTALEVADGGLLVFADDDITPSKGWLAAYKVGTQEYSGFSAYGGPVEDTFEGGCPEWVLSGIKGVCEFSSDVAKGWPEDNQEFGCNMNPLGANMAIPRKTIYSSGLRFNDSIGPRGQGRIAGSETELLLRIRRNGGRLFHLKDVKVLHRIPKELQSPEYLRKRAMWFGRGFARITGFTPLPTIAGVPRFLIRMVPVLCAKMCVCYILRNRGGYFNNQLRMLKCAAIAAEYWRGNGSWLPAEG